MSHGPQLGALLGGAVLTETVFNLHGMGLLYADAALNLDIVTFGTPIRYGWDTAACKHLLHFVFHPEHMPGTLIEAASAHGIRGLIVECGNHYAKQAVETARQHMYNFLIHHHLIDESFMLQETTAARVTFYESIQAIKPHTDFTFLIKDIETGTRLKKGQKFAKDDHGYHIAPQDCYVVVPSKAALPTDADAGFLGRLTVMTPSQ